jgi:hypothetical protein
MPAFVDDLRPAGALEALEPEGISVEPADTRDTPANGRQPRDRAGLT